MKKFRISLIASLFLLLSGCQSEELVNQQNPIGSHSLVATIEGQDYIDASRTAVDDSGNVTWITTDELGVYGSVLENVKYSSTGNGSDVTFTGNLPETETAEWAYYPYDKDASLNEGKLTITLPDQYTYTGNSNAPMLGKSSGNDKFSFKHLGGLIRFTLGGGIPDDAYQFVITSMGENQPITGQASFAIEGDNVTMSITSDGKQNISYDVSAIKDAEEFQYFFVPLPVGDYTKLQISFYKKNSEAPVFTRSLSNLTVKRAEMICMPILDWNTGKQYTLNENTTDLTDLSEDGVIVTLKESDNSLQLTGLEESEIPEVGQILWSQPTEELPYGFMGKVKDTTSSNGTVTITTENVGLDEVFDELLIEESVPLVPIAESRTGVIDIDESYRIPIFLQNMEEGYDIQGELTIDTRFLSTIHINKEKKINRMNFSLQLGTEINAGMILEAKFNEDGDAIGPFGLKDLNFPPVPLGGGVVVVCPAIQFKLHLEPSGSIKLTTGVNYASKCVAGTEYYNGNWEYGINRVNNDEHSPWDVKNIQMKGNLFLGAGMECKFKLYNNDKLKFYIEPKVGINLSGELEINPKEDNLQETLEDLYLTSKNLAYASAGFDAKILDDQDAFKVDLPGKEWGEKRIYLLPTFENLAAQTRMMTSGSRASTDPFEATITMTGSRELLSKFMRITTTIVNEKDNNNIRYGNYVDYEVVGGGNSSQNFTTTFSNLNPNEGYRAYPKVNSPILGEELNYELELTEQNVSFRSPAMDLRDQLVQLYKNAGGENWTNNVNWLSDKPIETWYGIYESNGKYDIMLPNNNLTGTFSLSSPDIQSVDINDNQVENLYLGGCTELTVLGYNNNQLVALDLSGCENLNEFYAPEGLSYLNISGCKSIPSLNIPDNTQLKYLNISECTSLSDINVDFDMLEEFYAKNCTSLKYPVIIDDGINREEVNSLRFSNIKVLDIENCSSIKHIYIDPQSGKITNINVKGCSSLFYLSCYNGQLTTINLEGCDKLETLYCSENQLSQLDLSKCPLLKDVQCEDNLLTDIDVTNNTELEKLWCGNNKLTSLDLTYNTQLKELYCNYNQLESLDFFSNPLMERIYCENNAISTIRLEKCGQLTYLTCRNNQLTSLNISQNKNLEKLYCSNNKLSELDFTKLSNLSSFEGRNLNIKDVDVSNLTSLSYFSCTGDYLQSVNLGGCLNLKDLHISGPITDFNHDMCNALESIDIRNTNLSSLDFNGCTALTEFWCYDNGQLVSLNLSGCTSMVTLRCTDNPMLTDLTLMTYAPLESVNFLRTKVSMEIPAFFPLKDDNGGSAFSYERRYTNYEWITNSDGSRTLTYTDNGYGWWYPGEPESGKHN